MTTPFANRPLRQTLLLSTLAAGCCAQPKVTVTLAQPPLLEAGHPYSFTPVIAGAGAHPECLWSVTENGLLVGRGEGVRLDPGPHGRVTFTAAAHGSKRTFLLRATSRLDPSAFATLEVEVVARGEAAAPQPNAHARNPQPYPCPPARPRPLFWGLGLHRELAPAVDSTLVSDRQGPLWTAATWDPGTQNFLILERDPDQGTLRILRGGLDGKLEGQVHLAPGPLTRPEGQDFWRAPAGFATLANGDLVVADSRGGRILRITRDGVVTTLAGSAKAPATQVPDGREAARAFPAAAAAAGAGQGKAALEQQAGEDDGLAIHAHLTEPAAIVVTAEDEIVFADRAEQKIMKITASGRLVTLAGCSGDDPQGAPIGRNDLRLRYPASAARLEAPRAIALAPDGRIVFANGDDVCALLRDGTLVTLAEGVAPVGLAVTTDNEVVFTNSFCRMGKITADGRLLVIASDDQPCDSEGYWQELPQASGRPVAGPKVEVAEQASFRLGPLVATPGGGVLLLSFDREGWFMGPGRGEHALLKLVQDGVAAAARGDDAGRNRIRASLGRWLPADGRALQDAVFKPLSKGGAVFKAMAADAQRHASNHLHDPLGLAVRARVALNVMARAISDLSSKAAAGQANPAPAQPASAAAAAGAGAGQQPAAKVP